jgi:hypothetical protein
MPSRRGPISYTNYQRIHDRRIEDFVNEGFVISHNVTFGPPSSGHITVEGDIYCLGGITVEVRKRLKILRGKGPKAMVKTSDYAYNVYANGRGNLFRYDSPHEHRPYHHVHRYDVLATWSELSVEDIGNENKVPTLGEVIEEARDLYYAHEF